MENPNTKLAVRFRTLAETIRTGHGSWADYFAMVSNFESELLVLGRHKEYLIKRLENAERALDLNIPPMSVSTSIFDSPDRAYRVIEMRMGMNPPIYRMQISQAQISMLDRDRDDKTLRRFHWRSYLGFCRHIRRELERAMFLPRDLK